MAYTTINKSSDYFNTVLYTGNGAAGGDSTTISSLDFAPNLVWIKNRTSSGDATSSHALTDTVRGVTKTLSTNLSTAEATYSNALTNFSSNGFTVSDKQIVNGNGDSLVAWNWKANGAGSANTDGDIASTVSASATSGFSIVKFTGTGANANIGHGLGVAPKVIIQKGLDASLNWKMYHSSLGAGAYINFDDTAGSASSTVTWNNTAPTNSLFYVGSGNNNNSSQAYIAYCFAEKQGYSKFGSYTGNGNTDGTFVYTGFAPKFIMVKDTTSVRNWHVFDTERDGYGKKTHDLKPNLSSSELSVDGVHWYDYLSNGFKVRMPTSNADYSDINASGNKYIYMAFAEHPLVGSNNVPATAR